VRLSWWWWRWCVEVLLFVVVVVVAVVVSWVRLAAIRGLARVSLSLALRARTRAVWISVYPGRLLFVCPSLLQVGVRADRCFPRCAAVCLFPCRRRFFKKRYARRRAVADVVVRSLTVGGGGWARMVVEDGEPPPHQPTRGRKEREGLGGEGSDEAAQRWTARVDSSASGLFERRAANASERQVCSSCGSREGGRAYRTQRLVSSGGDGRVNRCTRTQARAESNRGSVGWRWCCRWGVWGMGPVGCSKDFCKSHTDDTERTNDDERAAAVFGVGGGGWWCAPLFNERREGGGRAKPSAGEERDGGC
jgi:hypothetical protein